MQDRIPRLAILDDYRHLARQVADWSAVEARCAIEVFDRNLGVPDEAARCLAPFDIICTFRERMAVPRSLLERLPNLRLIAITGSVHRTLDIVAATERGIVVCNTKVREILTRPTPELAWGLILSLARHIHVEAREMRSGGWQNTMGTTLYGKTLGLLGLGRIGRQMARVGNAFDMRVIAWSENLTDERAAEAGAERVERDALFRKSDMLSIHLVLGERTRGLVGARELSLMKPTAFLINTARGPIVDEAALLETLRTRRIAGAGLDVFDHEPLSDEHPLRRLDNVVLTPHLGFATEDTLRSFYTDAVENVTAFLDGRPIRVINPAALEA
jgi:D-3-phosphoglycerate dehydrogenase